MSNEAGSKKETSPVDTAPFNSRHIVTKYTDFHKHEGESVAALDARAEREEAAEIRREARQAAREARARGDAM